MTVGIYVVLQPPLSALLGLFLGEQYTWHQAVGSVLVLSGLLFVNANAQVKKLLIKIYYGVLGREPPDKDFEILNSSESESSEIGDEKSVEMSDVTVSVLKDGASVISGTGEESEQEGVSVYTFKEKATNDIVIDNPHGEGDKSSP